MVDVVRAEVFAARVILNYVKAGKGTGAGITGKSYVPPYCCPRPWGPLLTFFRYLYLNRAPLRADLADFLGFGLPSGSPSLGELIAKAKPL